jgi:nucleoside-diphosphate-sugar epimerase
MTKTMLVTGASGFVGGRVARYFANLGWRVIGYGRRFLTIPGVEYRQWDIETPLAPMVENVDVLVHSAAKVDDFGDEKSFYRANVQGTRHVLDAFPNVGQFIYISSSSVYDPFAEKIAIREDFPYGKRYLNHYGSSKMQAEKLLLTHRPDNLVILRPRAVYGVGDTTLLPRLLQAKRGRFLLGIGDGQNELSLTYIDNLVHAVECAVERHFRQVIFNIADEQTITLETMLRLFAEKMTWDVQLLFIPRSLAWGIASLNEALYRSFSLQGNPTLTRYSVQQLSSTYTLTIEKAQKELGYLPRYTYSEGFEAVKAWLDQAGGG